ncbi:MAG: hypothetical protein DMF94_34195 [Acidobacteria bacterium]|nr:MAG: hypothetical protein DMF94_34195 [Acidobacteriota bacterium]
MTKEPQDATWLFQGAHKSEQWWTSLASMLLIDLGRHQPHVTIPLWRYETDHANWRFHQSGTSLAVAAATFSNVMVETNLATELFPGIPWDERFLCTPDLLIHQQDSRRITIIENKTERASIGRLALYGAVNQHLLTCGWDARLVVLISCGHPDDSIWREIERQRLELLLWEDLLRLIDQSQYLRWIFDEPLSSYYACPRLEGLKRQAQPRR